MRGLFWAGVGLVVCLWAGLTFGQNHPPELVPPPILDMRLLEDSNLNELLVARLNTKFTDPDGDTLEFSLIDPPRGLNFRINQQTSMLSRRLEHNFFTVRPLPVIVKAEDAEFAAYDTFMVTVYPSPDTLLPFHLVLPFDSANAPDTDFITFNWTQAGNVDLDRVDYILFIERVDHDTIEFASFTDTTEDIPSAILWRFGDAIRWWAWAYAGPDSVRSIETFTLLPPLGVSDFILNPSSFSLSPPFPNPFNSSTTISFSLSPSAGRGGIQGGVRLAIYDLSGRLVTDLLGSTGVSAGNHKVVWDARDVPAGVYLVRLEAGSQTRTQKLVLMR